MVTSTTKRLGLKKYSEGSDPHPNRTEFNVQIDKLEELTTLWGQGQTAARPTAGLGGRLYWDEQTGRMYWDNGVLWREVTSVGGGGAGAALAIDGNGVEGVSDRTARADHTHPLPLATGSVPGAMSAADKALINAATDAAVFNAIAKRDAAGRLKVGAPVANADAVTKGYADGLFGGAAAAIHTHTAADITGGIFAPGLLPAATTAQQGAISAADKMKIDRASAAATPNTLMMADANGRYQAAAPSAGGDVTNKTYVDGGLSGKSDTGHTHAYGSLTGIPATFAPITGAAANQAKPGNWMPSWGEVAGKPSAFAPSAHTHNVSDIDGVLPGAQVGSHTHPWAQITGAPATYAPSAHTHTIAEVTGIIPPSQIANVTSDTDGLMSSSDKKKLDKATSIARGSSGSTLVMRSSDETFECATPTFITHVTNKDYVDKQVATRAASSHSHSWGSITGKPTEFNPTGHLHPWTSIVQTDVIYNTNAATGGSYRAVWVNNSGVVGYNISSEKYKTNIEDYTVSLDVLRTLRPKSWNYKADVAELGDAAPRRVNFIAEHLHDAGLTEYVSYDGKGTGRENVETINEQLMVNALWSFQQQILELVDGLTAELANVKAELKAARG